MNRRILTRIGIAISLTAAHSFGGDIFWTLPRAWLSACIIAGTALVGYGVADDFLTKDA